MNTPHDTGLDGLQLAADRVAEIDALSQEIRDRLREMTANVKEVTSANLNAITNKLDLLHAAHLKVLAAEDKFHAKTGADPDEHAVNYDEIRTDIGRQLDRLRNALIAEGVSWDVDGPAAEGAAVSVRLLGDAASDRTER